MFVKISFKNFIVDLLSYLKENLHSILKKLINQAMSHNSIRRSSLINNYSSSNNNRQYGENTQQSSNNFLSDQITNLSLTVNNQNSDEVKTAMNNIVNRTTSAPYTITTDKLNRNIPNNECSKFVNNSNDSNQAIVLGDYLLFKPETSNDLFALAKNSKTNESFYWKKFDRCDYMKKLEPYLIMENSNRIFGFKEILFDSTNTNSQQFVYLIFNRFYGDLHSYMKEKKRLDETEAKNLFRQCAEAVNDCHQNGIIVRDIKLKKFVFTDFEKTKIALTNPEDFLILDEDAENDLIKSQQGCPAYVSPEVLNTHQSKYSGKLSDSWSLGIVLFTLLLGRYPFHHQTITTMFAKIARAKFQIPPSTGLSLDAKTLLRSLIRLNPSERLLPSEILTHNWLKQSETNITQLQQNKFKSLSSAYQYLNHLGSTTHVPLGNNQFYHKPLGISRSSPGSTLSPTSTNQQNYFSFQSNTNIISSSNKDNNDRLVPEFNEVPAQVNEPKKTNFLIDNSNNFLV